MKSSLIEHVGMTPAEPGETKGTVLMIAANPAVSEQTGWPIGYSLVEPGEKTASSEAAGEHTR